MARPREFVKVKVGVYDSPRLRNLPTDLAELLFHRLLGFVDCEGRYPADPDEIAAVLGGKRTVSRKWTGKAVAGALGALERADLIERYEVESEPYLQIRRYVSSSSTRKDREPPEPEFPGPLEGCRVNDVTMPINDGHCPVIAGREERRLEKSREDSVLRTGSASEAEGPTGPPSDLYGVALTPTGKPSTKRAGTPQAELVEFWASRWEETRGVAWKSQTSDFIVAAKILTLAGGDPGEARVRAGRLLGESEDEWLVKNASLGILLKRWNQLAVDVRPMTQLERDLAWTKELTPKDFES
jgi:hypothetical protein